MESSYLRALLGHSLFNGFSESEIARMFELPKYKVSTYGKGHVIHMQNEICAAMDIILIGRASVQKIDSDGDVLKIASFTSGDILGANLLFSKRNQYPYTVVAETETLIIHIKRELILEISQMSTLFLSKLLGIVSDRVLVLTDKIEAISMKTIRQRVIDVLKYEYYLQGHNPIRLSTSKKDLAERLGIQRTSLSRELNKMRQDGLLEYDAKTIRLNKPLL